MKQVPFDAGEMPDAHEYPEPTAEDCAPVNDAVRAAIQREEAKLAVSLARLNEAHKRATTP